MQMSKVPIIYGYAVIFCLIMSRDFQEIKVKVKEELFDSSEIYVWARVLGLSHQPTDYRL